MKLSSFLTLSAYGLKSLLLKKKIPILGTVILTDQCNLSCKHCSVNRRLRNVRAVSFNFHTPYPDTEALVLTMEEKRRCCALTSGLMDRGVPVFNLKIPLPDRKQLSHALPPVRGDGKRQTHRLWTLLRGGGPLRELRLLFCRRVHPSL